MAEPLRSPSPRARLCRLREALASPPSPRSPSDGSRSRRLLRLGLGLPWFGLGLPWFGLGLGFGVGSGSGLGVGFGFGLGLGFRVSG